MAEASTTVNEIIENQPKPKRGARADVVVVTPDTYQTYVDKQLGVKPEEKKEEVKESPEDKAKAELAEIEAKKAKEKAEAEEIDHPDKDKKSKLNERFSELTEKRKAAEAKAQAAEDEAKKLRQEREQIERERNELKAKYEPPKEDLGPEPQPEQFTDPREYGKALKEWTEENTRKEDARKQAEAQAIKDRQALAKAWDDRQAAHVKENPSYTEKLAKSDVKVSDQMRDAILESEVGPKILEHLADHPDVAEALGKMTVGRMLKEMGKLEATLSSKTINTVTVKQEPKAEISRAPAPITPLRGDGAPVIRLTGHDDVPSGMTYEDWKKLRSEKKIK